MTKSKRTVFFRRFAIWCACAVTLGGMGVGMMYITHPPKLTGFAIDAEQITLAKTMFLVEGIQIHPLPPRVDIADYIHVPIPIWSKEGDAPQPGVLDLARLFGDSPMTPAAISAVNRSLLTQEGVEVTRVSGCCGDDLIFSPPVIVSVDFSRDDLRQLGRNFAGTSDFEITREQWNAGHTRTLPEGVTSVRVPIPVWGKPEDSFDLAAFVRRLRGIEEPVTNERTIDLARLFGEQPMTYQTIIALNEEDLVQDGVTISRIGIGGFQAVLVENLTGTVRYTRGDLRRMAIEIADGDEHFELTREDWQAAQTRDWMTILLYPGIFVAVFFVLFLVFGRGKAE